ncbi:hypothetical protein OROHE_019543 [Orobanche hederae]
MAWYKRSSRFIVDAIRLQKSVSTITFSHTSSPSNSRNSGFCQTLLRSFVSQNALKNMQCYKSPFLDGPKRFFKPKGFKNWTGLLGYGVVISACYWGLERVPYTKRSHFVLLSASTEKKIAEYCMKRIKSEYKGKILPPLHPSSIRVQRIGHEIVEAAEKGLRKEAECLTVKIFK